MSQVICPICGKFFSVRHYDPSDFEDDILLVQVRGLGRGKGVEVVEKYSLLDGSNPELLDMISDRVAVIYDLLYEDVEDDEAEDVEDDDEAEKENEDIEEALREVLVKQAELEKLVEEAEEEYLVDLEDDDEEEEDEDINDLEENIIE